MAAGLGNDLRGGYATRTLRHRGRRAAAPREIQVRTRRRLIESPGYWTHGQLPLPPESKGNGLRLAGEPSLG